MIPQRRFGKTELQVSTLGFGGAEIGLLDIDHEQVASLLHALLDRGINVIDTAAMYGSSEQLIGEAIGQRRSEYVLISKCGHPMEGIDAPAWSAELIRQSVDRSLANLQTDRIDVMLLHSCDLETLQRGEAWEALKACQAEGKLRFIGYSGDNEAAAHAAGLPELAVIQTSINICDQRNIEHVLPVCLANDVGVMVKRPLANAAWRAAHEHPGRYAEYASTYTERLQAMNISPHDLAHDGAVLAWSELALRFVLSFEGVHTAIIGTTNPARLDQNIAAAQSPPLPQPVIDRLRAAFTNAEAQSGEAWLGQT